SLAWRHISRAAAGRWSAYLPSACKLAVGASRGHKDCPFLLGNQECPHYILLQVTLPSSFTPLAVWPVKLTSALSPCCMSVVVILPVRPFCARSAFWNGSSALSGRVSIS